MAGGTTGVSDAGPKLRRVLGLWDLVLYGIVVIQPTAPMPVYGVVSERAHGHVVTAVLIAMVAMLFTAISYGRMARVYPSAGSAFTYVGREIHPALGFVTGWGMVMDYLLNPLICTILCAQLALNLASGVPYVVWAIFFAALFTGMNLFGIRTTARINDGLAIGMGVVIAIFFVVAARYIFGHPHNPAGFFTRPFYDRSTFQTRSVLGGTSLAVLTYIGFDGISTLSEEAKNPRRDILWATVLVCLVTGALAACEVYAAQLVWPPHRPFPDVVTAYVHVAGLAGGAWLLQLVNATLLVATVGSGMGSQLGAARLLYAMGRGNAIPRSFFGAIDPKRRIPRNNILFSGALALAGALTISFARGVDLLNFGALIAFMGVNAASLVHYFIRARDRGWSDFVPPVLGFLVCFLLWWNLNSTAKIAGSVWMAAGLAYGAYRTRGFRGDLVNFDIPQDER
ncbi:MAG: APC family permease [Candidatus Acidiferrales bacterium]